MLQRSVQGKATLYQLEGTSHHQDTWDFSHIQGMSHLEDNQVMNHRVILKDTHLLGDMGSQSQHSQ
jgi:hypothetical protein